MPSNCRIPNRQYFGAFQYLLTHGGARGFRPSTPRFLRNLPSHDRGAPSPSTDRGHFELWRDQLSGGGSSGRTIAVASVPAGQSRSSLAVGVSAARLPVRTLNPSALKHRTLGAIHSGSTSSLSFLSRRLPDVRPSVRHIDSSFG